MNYMSYLGGMPQQLMAKMAWSQSNSGNIFSWFLCMTFGFLLYVYALRLIFKDGIDPYPIWLHCWMITIDTIGSTTFIRLAIIHNGFWLFDAMGIGLPIWVCMEAFCIINGLRNNTFRQEQFGMLSNNNISIKSASFFVASMIIVSFSVNIWVLSLIGGIYNAAIFIAWPFTNYVFAYWTWRLWTIRGLTDTRHGNSLVLQLIIVIQIALMWIPKLSWYLNISPYFNQPWYYVCGIVASILTGYNLYKLLLIPAKNSTSESSKKVKL